MRTRLDTVVHLRLAPEMLNELKGLATWMQQEKPGEVVTYSELIREAIEAFLQSNRT